MVLPGLILVLKIISFIIASWLLVHLLAVFGVFLAVSYSVWWFLLPRQIPCLWCRIKKSIECPFSHCLLDAGVILVFSLISFGLVFAESKILFKLGFPPTPKTVSFVIPSKGQYRLEEIFPMKIEIAGVKTPINAVQADVSFDPQKLEVVEISTEDSFANIFIQKEFKNEVGYARLTGGLPNPGFFADHGFFGTIFFKGKVPGLTKVEFLPSSLVLANDGRGTNVIRQLASASYLILPEKISAEEKKEQEVLIQPLVLGEETEETQMKFYEENKVLGEQVGQEIEKGKRFSLGKSLLEIFEGFDRFVLSFWGKVFQLL